MTDVASGIAAVRGAITVAENTAEAIVSATARLLTELMGRNALRPDQIVSAIFTATEDLDADFPAHAARRLGWADVPLLGAREITVPHALPRVVRVLLTVRDADAGRRLIPAYLEGAAALRPDLAPESALGAPQAAQGGAAAGGARGRERRRVAIVGLGQIGGSIGLALGRDGRWDRTGFDVAPEVGSRALALGAVDRVAGSIEDACAGAAIAVVAIPVDRMAEAIERVASALPAGAALVDTGSARAGVTEALARAAEGGVRAVGGHPLAGSEGHGVEAARGDLFHGAPFALLPIGPLPPIALELVRALGAEPVETTPEAHDGSLARTSHLPYLVACALEALGHDDARRRLAGPGFRDMTRLAASDPRVALAYCRANAAEVTGAWRALREQMDRRVAELERPGGTSDVR